MVDHACLIDLRVMSSLICWVNTELKQHSYQWEVGRRLVERTDWRRRCKAYQNWAYHVFYRNCLDIHSHVLAMHFLPAFFMQEVSRASRLHGCKYEDSSFTIGRSLWWRKPLQTSIQVSRGEVSKVASG